MKCRRMMQCSSPDLFVTPQEPWERNCEATAKGQPTSLNAASSSDMHARPTSMNAASSSDIHAISAPVNVIDASQTTEDLE